jgi:hypothetical protein
VLSVQGNGAGHKAAEQSNEGIDAQVRVPVLKNAINGFGLLRFCIAKLRSMCVLRERYRREY